ncbi:hypothetical protein [Streptomyces syringium]|uniref:hypothetical protein n=1 Tax=Streptomyces syringium TaxID=76729 RepID=UPI003453F5EA
MPKRATPTALPTWRETLKTAEATPAPSAGADSTIAARATSPTTPRTWPAGSIRWAAGALGAAITTRLFGLGWLRYGVSPRVVHLTDAGADGLRRTFGVAVGG